MSNIPAHLLTPRDWQAEAVAHAARECGTPEGRRALAEATRYGALADRLAELQAEIERLRGLLSREQQERHAALAEVDRITEAGRVHIRRAAALEAQRDALAARLATIEQSEPVQGPVRLTDEQIERGRAEVFSVGNPFCPCDAKTMRKAVRWAETAIWRANNLEAAAPAQVQPKACRDDGRCQYAIDHGAEGLGHCPPGKCVMPCEGGAA